MDIQVIAVYYENAGTRDREMSSHVTRWNNLTPILAECISDHSDLKKRHTESFKRGKYFPFLWDLKMC